MAITSYAGLQGSVSTWAVRQGDPDFASAVPDFVAFTESLLNHGSQEMAPLRVREMEAVATLTLDADGAVNLPEDYLEYRSVQVAGYPLAFLTPDEFVTRETNGETGAGFFTIQDGSLRVLGGADLELTLLYYQTIPALSDTNTSNWLLAKAPNVYLFGSLTHAAPFMGDDARVALWAQMFTTAVAGLRASDQRGRYARVAMRVGGHTP
jgi:hypothetical protein